MIRNFWFSTFLFAIISTFSLQAQQQYEGKVISSIDVIANKLPEEASFDSQVVLMRLKTKINEIFSQNTFDSDLKTLAEEYDRILPSLKIQNNQLHITLNIWLKPSIRKIVWTGNDKVKTPKLQKELNIPLKSTFDRATFNRAFHKIKAYYVKNGFFEAELDYSIQADDNNNEIDIEIKINEGRSGRIKEISFLGFSKTEEEDLLDLMLTKKYNLFTSWFTGSGTYHEEAIEQDKLGIINYLQNLGFADAKVNIHIEEIQKSNRIKIIVSTEKGPRYTFGKISFEGNTLYSDDEIKNHLTMFKNDPYSPDKIRESIRNVTDLYGTKGYIETYATYEPHLTNNKTEYTVHCTIHEGEQYHVGMIKIFGNTSTHSRVILHEALLTPGDIFDTRKLQATEEKLQLMGYFKNVNVYWVKSSDKKPLNPHFRDVHIEVEESSTGSFSFAFGISTLESIFGSIEILERNFNYKGISRIFADGPNAMRGDGEYVRSRLNVGKKHRNMILSWTKPHFRDTPWIVGFNIEKVNNRQQSDDYDIDSLGFSLHASYPINAFLRFEWQYRLRNINIKVNDTASQALKNEADNSGLLSASGLALAYDSTDNPYKPKNGFLSRLDAEFSGLGGDFSFLGFSYVNSYYIQLNSRGVFKYRADAKFIHPLGTTTTDKLPLAERLFLGGETSVRGYRPFSIGPKYDNKHPRGGISSALLSIEYLHNLTERVDVFSFIDAGHVSLEKYRIGQMQMSYGFGLRLEVFKNMPLIFGMGYPVNPKSRDEIKRFFFSIGGHF